MLHVVEHSTLERPGSPLDHRTFEFTMRPWNALELRDRLTAAGFEHIDITPGVGRATDDRLFITAHRQGKTTP